MNKTYYVIVNLTNLCYTKDGQDEQSIINADKFKSYIDAKAELAEYDDDFNGVFIHPIVKGSYGTHKQRAKNC